MTFETSHKAASITLDGSFRASRVCSNGVMGTETAVGIDDETSDAVDGRVLRGRRNREAIVDAMVAMYAEGILRPTAAQVAETAGLSTRSVYHHFDDMKSLILEVSARSEARVTLPDFAALGDVELSERIVKFAAHRCHRWWITGPVVRAGLMSEDDSEVVSELMTIGRARRLDEITVVFGSELAKSADPEATAAALDVVFGFDAWHRLSAVRHLDEARAVAVIAKMASGLL